jgi:hypothetical protein
MERLNSTVWFSRCHTTLRTIRCNRGNSLLEFQYCITFRCLGNSIRCPATNAEITSQYIYIYIYGHNADDHVHGILEIQSLTERNHTVFHLQRHPTNAVRVNHACLF